MDEVVVITFDGDIEDFPVLVQSVDNLTADGVRRVVIDLHNLAFINSAALGYLLEVHKGMERRGGGLALVRVRPAVQNILKITNLDEMLRVFPTEKAGIDHLTPPPDAEGGKPRVRRHPWR